MAKIVHGLLYSIIKWFSDTIILGSTACISGYRAFVMYTVLFVSCDQFLRLTVVHIYGGWIVGLASWFYQIVLLCAPFFFPPPRRWLFAINDTHYGFSSRLGDCRGTTHNIFCLECQTNVSEMKHNDTSALVWSRGLTFWQAIFHVFCSGWIDDLLPLYN